MCNSNREWHEMGLRKEVSYWRIFGEGAGFMGQDQGRIFSSWKEIAGFLGKGVRTVQRWEKTHGLPVSRPIGCASNVVFAKEEELVRWMRNQDAHDTAVADSAEAQFRQFQECLDRLEETHLRLEQSLLETEKRLDYIERAIGTQDLSRMSDLPGIKPKGGGDGNGSMSAD